MTLFITGIGSRQTPDPVLKLMEEIAVQLTAEDLWVRSGHADGADLAFEKGAKNKCIAYVPWSGFNKQSNAYTKYIRPFRDASQESKERALASVEEYHPAPNNLTAGGKMLMARNYFQVMGENESPSLAVLFWTKDGGPTGGTGQAWRIADRKDIPRFYIQADTSAESIIETVINLKSWDISLDP